MAESLMAELLRAAGLNPALDSTDGLTPDERLDVFIAAHKLQKEAKARDKFLGAIKSKLDAQIVEEFQRLGQQSVNRNGVTVSLSSVYWPKVVNEDLVPEGQKLEDLDKETQASIRKLARARLTAALAGDPSTEFLVDDAYNAQSLASWINELPADEETMLPLIPEHLKGLLDVTEQFKAVPRGS